MNIKTKDTQKEINSNLSIFNAPYNEGLIHQSVTRFMNCLRAGTVSQKTRSEVRGGGKKPWKQKGTGRARAGSIRSPLWKGGGVIFAAKPRDYSAKINKKMYRLSIRSILSELLRLGRLHIVSELSLENNKTKTFIEKIKHYNVANALIIKADFDVNDYLSTRNLTNYDFVDPYSINPAILLKYENVIIVEDALTDVEELFK